MATHKPVVITLNGGAKAIIQDIREYEKDLESLALLYRKYRAKGMTPALPQNS